jgi:predicted DCC family thiol-disulfide oxidoreductase YuxK
MHPVILYDGVCGLCNRFVQYVLDHDRAGTFRFAALQGDLAAEILRRHGRDPAELSTVVVVLDLGEVSERLLIKSSAALYVLKALPGPGRWLAPLGWLPSPLLDFGYDRVAHNRYRVFGREESCRLPHPDERARFLDMPAGGPA